MSSELERNSDSLVAFAFIKRLMEPITKTKAYEFGLVNSSGKITREPINQEESDALTILDQICFKLRRYLGTKISEFNALKYIESIPKNYTSNLNFSNPNANKSEIKRLKGSLEKILESSLYNENLSMDFCKFYRGINNKGVVDSICLNSESFKISLNKNYRSLNESCKRFVDLVLPEKYLNKKGPK